MGVNIDDTDNSWRGPGGMEGRVNNGFGGGKGGGFGGKGGRSRSRSRGRGGGVDPDRIQ